MMAIVVAVAENGVIGRDNRLPWHLPEDLRRFKEITLGGTVVMGRRTFESIGKPLPGRRNVVVSGSAGFRPEGGVAVARSLPEALAGAQGDVFVIGGASLFAEALERADRLYFTRIHREVEGDVRFPPLDWGRWRVTREERREGANGLPFSFIEAERIR